MPLEDRLGAGEDVRHTRDMSLIYLRIYPELFLLDVVLPLPRAIHTPFVLYRCLL